MSSDTDIQDWATSWMKLGICKRVSRNESEPLCKPRYTNSCGQGLGDSETSIHPVTNGTKTEGTRRGQGGQRARKVLSGTWETRRATPAGVG